MFFFLGLFFVLRVLWDAKGVQKTFKMELG